MTTVRSLLLSSLVALAVGGVPAALPVRAQPLEVVRLGAGPDDQATPLLYAAKSGLYRRYGLDVQVVKLAGAAAVAAALAGGSLEIGKGSTLTVVTAIAKGVPFTVIGNLSYYESSHPDIAMITLTNSNIRTAKDLVGKTVSSVSLQDQNMLATYAWLERNGVERTQVKFVELPQSAVLSALEQGRLDASSTFEPFLSAALGTGKARIMGYPHDTIAAKFSNAVLFTTTSWALAHRDTVTRFLRASEEASTYISAHDDVSSQLIAEFSGIDPATVAMMRHARRGIAIDPAVVQPVIDAAAKYHVIDKPFPAKEMLCSCALLAR